MEHGRQLRQGWLGGGARQRTRPITIQLTTTAIAASSSVSSARLTRDMVTRRIFQWLGLAADTAQRAALGHIPRSCSQILGQLVDGSDIAAWMILSEKRGRLCRCVQGQSEGVLTILFRGRKVSL